MNNNTNSEELLSLGTKVLFGEYSGVVTAQAKYLDGSEQVCIHYIADGGDMKNCWLSMNQFYGLDCKVIEKGNCKIGF